MKSAVIVVRDGMEHQKGWGGAFGRGLERRGWSVAYRNAPEKCDLLVLWGVRHVPSIRQHIGKSIGEVCILERAYVGDRFNWTSVSFGGGLNGHGVFRGPFHDASRWEKNFAPLLRDWRSGSNGYALILKQVPGDNSIRGVDMAAFYERARMAFEPIMPVKFRAHPNLHPRQGEEHLAAVKASLAQDLAGARVAVTYNSNSGVDAILAGVPTVAMDPGSMVWGIAGREMKMPLIVERAAWAHAIAWKQWRREEMESGFCQEMVGL